MLIVYRSQKFATSEALKSARDWLRWRREPASWLLLRHKSLDQSAQDAGEQFIAFDIQHRRNIFRVEPIAAGFCSLNLCQRQKHGSLKVFAFGQNLQVLARQRYRLLDARTVFIAQHLQFGVKAGADAAALQPDVDASGPVLRDGEIKGARGTAIVKTLIKSA